MKNAHINKIDMISSDKINVSEGINDNKTSKSKECDICHYWCF